MEDIMNFGYAFTYVFKDSDWFKKIIVPALCLLIPVIGQITVIGWALKIARRVIDNDPELLPHLDFGADLSRGFSAVVIVFVYALPILALSGFLAVLDAIVSGLSASEVVLYGMAGLSICAGLFALVYGLLLAFMIPAAFGHFMAKESLGAAFKIGQVIRLVRSAPGAYVIVVLGMLVVGFIAPMGSIACAIGVILTMIYAQAVMGYFYGQAYREATKNAAFVSLEE
jgi:hypothetical protein